LIIETRKMRNEKKHIDDELLGRWINGNLSGNEKGQVQQWADSATDNQKILDDVQKIGDDIELLNVMEGVDSESALHKVKSRIAHSTSRLSRFLKQWQRVAAVILIPLLVYNGYQIVTKDSEGFAVAEITWNEISTPHGLRSEFTLPDGSKVKLNGNTRLKYPLRFTGNERLVELEGEAFFDVETDKNQPFVVDAGKMLVEATGTSFNVMAYRDEDKIETALVEGKVNLYSKQAGSNQKLMALGPGQLAVYDFTTSRIEHFVENLDKYIAWREGKLLFKNDSMDEALMKIGRWYNVEFKLEMNTNEKYAFTGEFKGEPLSQILEYIELTTPVMFKESDSIGAGNQTNNKRVFYVKNNN